MVKEVALLMQTVKARRKRVNNRKKINILNTFQSIKTKKGVSNVQQEKVFN